MADQSPDETIAEAHLQLLAACAQEPETDIGNGRRFRRRFGDLAAEHEAVSRHIAMAVAHVGWHIFDGTRWAEDEDGSLVRPLAHGTAEAIRDEPKSIEVLPFESDILQAGEVAMEAYERLSDEQKKDNPEAKNLLRQIRDAEDVNKRIADRRAARRRHAKSSAGSGKINNMLQEAAPYVAAKVSDLNRDRYALNCANGTIRFVQREDQESDPDDPRFVWEAELTPHDQADMITKKTAMAWKPGPNGSGEPEEFIRFLGTVMPDPAIRAFLKRFFGYCLTGLINEQVLLFMHGAGRNGKSTLVETISHVMADYAVTLSIDSFSGDSKRSGAEATPDLARLPGARIVAASEPEQGVRLKDGMIKQITGGEKIPVRRLHQDFFEVDPHFKLVLSGNHKPRIDDDSDGIWRRVLLVPWTVQIPRNQVDRKLPEKLMKEGEAIFAWMVEGALEYLNNPDGLAIPDAVRAASQEYREESDPIGSFIRLACEVTGNPDDEEGPFDLFTAYEKYALREGAPAFKQVTFQRRFAKQAGRVFEAPDGSMKQFSKGKRGNTIYFGIRIRTDYLPETGHGDSGGRY